LSASGEAAAEVGADSDEVIMFSSDRDCWLGEAAANERDRPRGATGCEAFSRMPMCLFAVQRTVAAFWLLSRDIE
jgi:hypothetical protein